MKQYLEYWWGGGGGEGSIGNQGTLQIRDPAQFSAPSNFILLIILIAATLKLVEL